MSSPTDIRLTLRSSSRYDLFDVNRRIAEEHGDIALGYARAFYTSYHTTAGYIDPDLAERLENRAENVDQFIEGFQRLFPPDADYTHDQMHRRDELSHEQREVEPRNADSHLAYMGAGIRNCVDCENQPEKPVYFIDLDGVHGDIRRERTTTVHFYDSETLVAIEPMEVAVSRHPIDSVNLADPKYGLMERVEELLEREGLESGRVEIRLEPGESRAALTVNEYETLLMKHDLPEVLRNPFKYAAEKSYNMLRDPLAIPGKTKDYAKYDFVVVFNRLLETLGVNETVIERMLARVLAYPADYIFRMKRRVSLLAGRDPITGHPGVVRGTYQSPILVQWDAADSGVRKLELRVVRFE